MILANFDIDKKMARISISETQFAFAFFHKYLSLMKEDEITFIFPTLRAEGDRSKFTAGADLVVSNNLFFQFKMPEYLRNRSATEIQNEELPDDFVPFYRMPIKNSLESCQFDSLLHAAKTVEGSVVQYVAPMFHADRHEDDETAFYNYFRMSPMKSMEQVCCVDFAQFIDNNTELTKDDTHKICYNRSSVEKEIGYIFSQPKPLRVRRGVIGYNGENLNFLDNPRVFRSLEATVELIGSLFNFSTRSDALTSTIDLEELQARLIVEQNIFWIPVIRSISKRRVRIITSLLTELDDDHK